VEPLSIRPPRRLPEHNRTSCQGLHIMHCDAALWGATSAASVLSAGLWRKISWVSRLEFLDELVEKVRPHVS